VSAHEYPVRLVQSAANVGFGRACNKAAAQSSTPLLLFVNPDVVITRCDRDRLASYAREPFAGLIGCALADDTRSEIPRVYRSRGAIADWCAQVFGPLTPREFSSAMPLARGAGGSVWVSGALLLAARNEFLGTGGFDPRFFLYYEDRELADRYRAAARRVVGDAVVAGRHAKGTSSASHGAASAGMAWSFVSAMEYIAVVHGDRMGARAAVLGYRVLRFYTGVLGNVSARNGGGRLARKAQHLRALVARIEQIASGDAVEQGFAPAALCALRSVVPHDGGRT
jgi:GT2 family glycosyltransferase